MTQLSRTLPRDQRGRGVAAVLGPTNTGKTHLAIERMVAQPSGLIGLPLRLLAREVYARIVDKVGADKVALVTGEEKIKPPGARYWVSTVEAMPQDIEVDFVAVDEVQLAADLERGHVFTDRILNRRGRHETLLLGAATMRPAIEQLLPGANIIGRPRLSQLAFAGERKITRLPRRSAIVAFSADEVYAIAELIRRQRGGAAVVMGKLSPRTRNAQVALYQSGDVDYLVATDAIGMGLNLDVDHVAFASDRKFDGFQFRNLNPGELGQIAGRAGRHMRDGTFGTTARCPPFEAELVERLESHAFEPVRMLQWRNADLDFSSLRALKASLDTVPTEPGLTRAPGGEDVAALERASRDPDVTALLGGRSSVARLWEVCQVPDYRKVSPAAHADLVTTLYGFLMRDGAIPADWLARQIAQSDRTDGDIDTLSARIAHVRTWTFVANRPDWLREPAHWQALAREVEDRLSDALHDRLARRFVDRRTSVLMRRLREKDMLEAEVTNTGDVMVEGQHVGSLAGFRFTPDPAADGEDGRALRNAAQKALSSELDTRAERLSAAKDADIVLSHDGALRWLGEPVGRLVAGDKLLAPRVRLLADDGLAAPSRDKAEARLALWISAHVQKLLGPLLALEAAADLTGIARGIAFQLVEALGVLERAPVAEDVKSLDQAARAALRGLGLRFGAYHLYLPALLKPAPRALAAQLWALRQPVPDIKGLDEVPALAASGRTSFKADAQVPKELYRIVGYRLCGERAVRVDILERLADLIRPAIAWRSGVSASPPPPGAVEGHGFVATVAMMSLVGCSGEDFASILRSLGYRMEKRPISVLPKAPTVPAADAAVDAAPEAATATEDAGAAADPAPEPPAEAGVPPTEEGSPSPDQPAGAAPDDAMADLAIDTDGQPGFETPAAEPLMTESPAAEPDPADAAPAGEPDGAPGEIVTVPDAPAAIAAPEAAAEPETVEVWRPAGRGDQRRRPRHERPGGTQQRRDRAAQRHPGRSPRPPQEAGHDRPDGAPAPDRREARRQDGPPRDSDRRHDRAAKNGERRPSGGRPPERRADPDSPFAALAALKAQLEADKKPRR